MARYLPLLNTVFALLALTISFTALFLQIRTVDDIRVEFRNAQFSVRQSIPEEARVSFGAVDFTFVNLGNRPAGIDRISALVLNTGDAEPDRSLLGECRKDQMGGVVSNASLAPFVLEPGEMKHVRAEFPEVGVDIVDGWNPSKELVSCFHFYILDGDAKWRCPAIPALWFSNRGASGLDDDGRLITGRYCEG